MAITNSDANTNTAVANFDEALEQLGVDILNDPVASNINVLEAALHVM
ncbi:hypothetical protein ACFFLY_20430 [Vreelandella sulfidaeris]